MKITPITTPRIDAQSMTLFELLDDALPDVAPRSVIAITSKVVSLCEGAVVAAANVDKQALVRSEADLYIPDIQSKWNINFTVTSNTLIPNAGIDESNAGEYHVLWPRDAQQTANQVRQYVAERFSITEVGVIITDSTCRPLRRGVSGIAIAHSGFNPLRDYVGKPDLYGRPFKVSQADIAGGLAAAAVLVMGEGAESTPIVLMEDVSVVDFVDRDPLPEELAEIRIPLEDDLFAPFLSSVAWAKGDRQKQEATT